tara:strand:+ start:858 stop:1064 length:207 start_codon:yes stop_codon:yes gene_type:complete
MPLFRKEKEKSLVKITSDNLTNNSLLIKKSLNTTKNLVPPLSKVLDYAVVSFVSVLLFNLYTNYTQLV